MDGVGKTIGRITRTCKTSGATGEVVNGDVGVGAVGQSKHDGEGVALEDGEVGSVPHKGHAISSADGSKRESVSERSIV